MVDTDRSSGTALVRLTDSADALYFNEPLRHELATALREIQAAREVKTICLTGTADCFLVGVDLGMFRRAIEAETPEAVVQFTRRAHALLRQITQSPQPVVSWVHGSALGAGLELALACRRIVATPSAKFSLPETGLGIYPGMGGTQRLPRRIGVGLAKWMIYTGAIVPAEQALAIGLVDAVCPATASAGEVLEAASVGSTIPPPQLSERFATLERLFADHTVAQLLDPGFPPPADPQAQRAVIQLRSKAPIALRLAERIIDRGMAGSLEAGLALETDGLVEIFATEDARQGILSAGRTAIKFVGR